MLLELEAFLSETRTYSGLPIVNDTCPTRLRLFPSPTVEKEYITNNPLLFTIGSVLIFAFTSLVFLLYDWMVELRQRKVMATAVQTSAIVSSLFPSTVRDRLLFASSANKTVKQNHGIESWFFLHNGGNSESCPIADFYPNATVMFADM
jgi:hypothetical protein